ncbi:MAG: helix-turn-helix transcriptional regulator [Tateyamaria sp.]
MSDWIDALIGAKSPSEAANVFLDSLGAFDVVNVSHRVLIGEGDLSSFTTAPAAWRTYYFEQGYNRLDPSVLKARTANGPVSSCFDEAYPGYTATGRVREMFDGTREAVGAGAFCVYFRSRWATNMVTVFTDTPGHRFDSWAECHGAQLTMRGAVFSEKMQALLAPEITHVPDISGLTEREMDCITWLAHGLRVSAIAHRLGVSERTVEFHLTNARKKFGAPTRESLVAKVCMAQA